MAPKKRKSADDKETEGDTRGDNQNKQQKLKLTPVSNGFPPPPPLPSASSSASASAVPVASSSQPPAPPSNPVAAAAPSNAANAKKEGEENTDLLAQYKYKSVNEDAYGVGLPDPEEVSERIKARYRDSMKDVLEKVRRLILYYADHAIHERQEYELSEFGFTMDERQRMADSKAKRLIKVEFKDYYIEFSEADHEANIEYIILNISGDDD